MRKQRLLCSSLFWQIPTRLQIGYAYYTMSEKSSSHPDLERRTPSPSVTQYGSPESTVQPPIDPNIIDWDGPDDPEKPINWPRSRKAGVIGTVCLLRFVTYVLQKLWSIIIPA